MRSTKLSKLWQSFTKPSEHIKIEHRRDSQLLNQIMLVFLQLVLALLTFIMILPNSAGMRGSFTIGALLIASTMLFIVFLTNRLGHYNLATWILFSGASCIVYWNASVSSAPHLEIMYIILIPLISILIVDLRSTVILTLVIAIVFCVFQYVYRANIEDEIFRDLSLIIALTNIIVIIVSYWRNRMESERRELYLEQEKSILIKELIANMSHDFKTPLTVINSSLYILEKTPNPLKREEYINRSKQQVLRLEGYIQDMLTILRLEDNNLQTHKYININQIIRKTLNGLSDLIEQKQLKIDCNSDERPVSLIANEDDIYRMMENLIKNAINYTPKAGRIIISNNVDTEYLHISIKDTGIGISQEDKKLIFERFFRADEARSTATGGTGLGLAIVKRVVDTYKGQITVDSEINKGTTFYVKLPVKSKYINKI